jgi:hypothetical protein
MARAAVFVSYSPMSLLSDKVKVATGESVISAHDM